MPVPKTRCELTELVQSTFDKLTDELDAAGPRVGSLVCVDDWTVKDLLAVRVWWTAHVVDWIESGRRGDCPITPAPGFGWKETPRLNSEVVARAKGESFCSLRARLGRGFDRVMSTIAFWTIVSCCNQASSSGPEAIRSHAGYRSTLPGSTPLRARSCGAR